MYLLHSSKGGKIWYLYYATTHGLDGEILISICANGLRAGGLSGTATRSRAYWSVADFRGRNPNDYSDEAFLKELEKGVPVEIPYFRAKAATSSSSAASICPLKLKSALAEINPGHVSQTWVVACLLSASSPHTA